METVFQNEWDLSNHDTPEEAQDRQMIRDEMRLEGCFNNQEHSMNEEEHRMSVKRHERHFKQCQEKYMALLEKYKKQLLDPSVHDNIERAIDTIEILVRMAFEECYWKDTFYSRDEFNQELDRQLQNKSNADMDYEYELVYTFMENVQHEYYGLTKEYLENNFHSSHHNDLAGAFNKLYSLRAMDQSEVWFEEQHYLEPEFIKEWNKRNQMSF